MIQRRVVADFSTRQALVVIGPDGTEWFFPPSSERNTRQNVSSQRLATAMVAATTAATQDRDDLDTFIEHVGVLAVRYAQVIFGDSRGVGPTVAQAEELVERGVVNYIFRFDAEERASDSEEEDTPQTPEEMVEEFDLDAYKAKMFRPTEAASASI